MLLLASLASFPVTPGPPGPCSCALPLLGQHSPPTRIPADRLPFLALSPPPRPALCFLTVYLLCSPFTPCLVTAWASAPRRGDRVSARGRHGCPWSRTFLQTPRRCFLPLLLAVPRWRPVLLVAPQLRPVSWALVEAPPQTHGSLGGWENTRLQQKGPVSKAGLVSFPDDKIHQLDEF